MNFPNSPTLNQTYSTGDKTWKWNGVAWDLQSTGLTSSHVVTALGYTPLNKAGDTMTGNLAFSGTGLRITGDFSNATVASRAAFQSSTTNGNTLVNLIPNGTATVSRWGAFNGADPANSGIVSLGITSTAAELVATYNGTGSYLPLTVYTGGSERFRVDTSGNVGFGTSSPAAFGAGRTSVTINGSTDSLLWMQSNGTAAGYLNGTSTTMGLTGNTDKNVVITAQGTGVTAFVAGGSERMRLNASGNFGLGLSSPSYRMDVLAETGSAIPLRIKGAYAASNNTQMRFAGNASGTDLWAIGSEVSTNTTGTAFDIYDLTAGANRLRINASGAFGFGSTPAYGTSGQVLTSAGSGAPPTWTTVSGAGGSSQWTTTGSDIYYTTGAVLGGTSSSIGSSPMRFQSKGGAGGVAPFGGYSIISAFDEVAGHFYLTSSGENSVMVAADPQNLRASTTLQFSVDGTERGRFSPNGYFKATNFGSYPDGNNTLQHYFTSNNASNSTFFVRADSTSLAGVEVAFIRGNTNTTNNTYRLFAAHNGNDSGRFQVQDSGNCVNTNNSYGSISDVKLKQDIVDATSQWDDIKSVKVKKFRFKNNPTGPLIMGVIAQELEATSPGLIDEEQDYEEVKVPVLDENGEQVVDENGTAQTQTERRMLETTTKSVKYSVLYMKAVKALQEAMERIEQLEARLDAANL